MRLYEEYIKRHNLAVPIISHADYSVLFLRREKANGIDWKIFTAQFRRDMQRHGLYQCILNQPQRNSIGSGYRPLSSWEIEWDCFEDYMLGFDGKDSIVTGTQEVMLAAWEIFVFQAERYLVKYASNDDFFGSLDLTLSVERRYEHINRFIQTNSFKTCEVYVYWTREMSKSVNDYSHALARVLTSLHAV
jgi:hypothetical protein